MYVLNHQSIIRQVMLGVLCALSLLTTRAVQADDVNRATSQVQVTVPPGGAFVTLIETTISTPTPSSRELVIHYFAECAVVGGGTTGFIEYDILVDGVAVSPTNDPGSALCQANQNTLSVGTVVFQLVAGGPHTIRVRGRMTGPGTGFLDEQSLVIEEEAP